MNTNSVLCAFISAHPKDWAALLLNEHCIKSKQEGDYAIFNYTFNCDYASPLVQEARGIIIDVTRTEVVCWPFRKFGNHNESYADKIDWATARVLEKVDGSIIKLWYDHQISKWQFSTNGIIRAEKASIDAYPGLCFGDLILRADNYKDIPFDTLDKNNTYIFELVSPETKVVIDYNSTSLYHIGTRNNLTGVESDEDIGIKKPASYKLGSLKQCLEAAAELNKSQSPNTDADVSKEGFVVVDGNWNRVKVKSPDYLVMHSLTQNCSLTKRDCLTMLINGDKSLDIMCEATPALVPFVKYHDYRLAELKYQADRMGLLARSLYREYDGNRQTVAKIISKHPLAKVGFRCIGNSKKGSDILMEFPIGTITRLIPDYVTDDIYELFLNTEETDG